MHHFIEPASLHRTQDESSLEAKLPCEWCSVWCGYEEICNNKCYAI